MNGPTGTETTLGFELAAFKAFDRPNEVVADARTWSRYVGLIATDTDAVTSYVQTHELNLDFLPGDRDKWLALEEIREKTNTDRHVFVGLASDDRMAAEHTGWEFVPVEEAAEKAGWALTDHTTRNSGFLGRIRDWF